MEITCIDASRLAQGSVFGTVKARGTYDTQQTGGGTFDAYLWYGTNDTIYLSEGSETLCIDGYATETDWLESGRVQHGFDHVDLDNVYLLKDTRMQRPSVLRTAKYPAVLSQGQASAVYVIPRTLTIVSGGKPYKSEFEGRLNLFNMTWGTFRGRPTVAWQQILDLSLPTSLECTKNGDTMTLHYDDVIWDFPMEGGADFSYVVAKNFPWPTQFREAFTLVASHFISDYVEGVFEPKCAYTRGQIDLGACFNRALDGSTRMNTCDVNWLENGLDVVSFLKGRSSLSFKSRVHEVTMETNKRGLQILNKAKRRYIGRNTDAVLADLRRQLRRTRRIRDGSVTDPQLQLRYQELESALESDIHLLESEGFLKYNVITEDMLRQLSSMWLEYRYVLQTTAMDIEGINDFVMESKSAMEESLSSISFDERVSDLTYIGDIRHNFNGYLSYGKQTQWQEDYSRLCQIGVFPTFANLWDIVPYSFIIDWFTDLGGILGNVDKYLLYRNSSIQWAYGFSTLNWSESGEMTLWNCKIPVTINAYSRALLKRVPEFGGFAPKLSSNPSTWVKRAVDGAALAITHRRITK